MSFFGVVLLFLFSSPEMYSSSSFLLVFFSSAPDLNLVCERAGFTWLLVLIEWLFLNNTTSLHWPSVVCFRLIGIFKIFMYYLSAARFLFFVAHHVFSSLYTAVSVFAIIILIIL